MEELTVYPATAGRWQLNFYSACNSNKSEIQMIFNITFHKSGRLRKYEQVFFLSMRKINKSNRAGFVNIADILVHKEFKSDDYQLRMSFYIQNQSKH